MFATLSCITAPGGHGTQAGIPARTVTTPEVGAALLLPESKIVPRTRRHVRFWDDRSPEAGAVMRVRPSAPRA